MITTSGAAPASPLPCRERARGRAYASPETTRWFMQHVRHVAGTAGVTARGTTPRRLPRCERDLLRETVALQGRSVEVGTALASAGTDAFLVVHQGVLVTEEYFGAMTEATPHLWQSMTKTLTGVAAGCLAEAGLLSPEQRVRDVVPELASSGYGDARVRDLLDMTVGLAYSEDYEDEDSDVCRLDRLYGVRAPVLPDEPGSSYEAATAARQIHDHGSRFGYASLNTQVLGWVLERCSGKAVAELLGDVVWGRVGLEHEAYLALDGAGSAQSEGGFCSSARDLARFGLMLRNGVAGGGQVISPAWLDDTRRNARRDLFARSPFAELFPGGGYRNCAWLLGDGFPGALAALGIYGQLLYVDPAADVVIAKYATWPRPFDPALSLLDLSITRAITQALA